MGFYYDSYVRFLEAEKQEKKEKQLNEAKRQREEQLNNEIRQLRNEVRSLKKVNTREEVTEKIKTMLLNDDILENKVKQITDYLMYMLERENK